MQYTKETITHEAICEDYHTLVLGKILCDNRGSIRICQKNFEIILDAHPLLKNIKSDSFSQRIVVVGPLPWDPDYKSPREWTNADDAELQSMFANEYDLFSPSKRDCAFSAVISRRSFHPVRTYLDGLTWDGVPRIDTVFIDYLGAEDTPLVRAITRKWLVAAVARIYKPGCKFDNLLTLVGSEGIGKSRILGYLGGAGTDQDWFTDSLSSIETKEAGEIMQGKWIIEMGELTNYKKSMIEVFKAFVSRTTDRFREAFARRSQDYPRQCVFAATTNELTPLKGDTGNRRFWLINVGVKIPRLASDEDISMLDGYPMERKIAILCKILVGRVPALRDQIWAEAVAAFNGNEELYLSNELEEMAKIAQENANELSTDPDIGLIEKYIKTPIPTDWDNRNIDQRRIYLRYGLSPQDAGIPLCHRTKVCSKEILHECYEMSKGDRECPALTRKINRILRSFDFLEEGKSDKGVPQHVLFSLYGRQQPYYIKAKDEDTIRFEE